MRKTLLAALLLLPLPAMAIDFLEHACIQVPYGAVNEPNASPNRITGGCYARAIRTSSTDPAANINTVLKIRVHVEDEDGNAEEREYVHYLSPTETDPQWRPRYGAHPLWFNTYHPVISCEPAQVFMFNAWFELGYNDASGWNVTHSERVWDTPLTVQKAGPGVCRGANSNHFGDGWKWRIGPPQQGW